METGSRYDFYGLRLVLREIRMNIKYGMQHRKAYIENPPREYTAGHLMRIRFARARGMLDALDMIQAIQPHVTLRIRDAIEYYQFGPARVCAWCKKTLRYGSRRRTTHGICPDCLKFEMRKIKGPAALNVTPGQRG